MFMWTVGVPFMVELPDPEEHPGVTKVKQMWERGDFEKIDSMVKYWEAMENLGLLGDMLRRFVIWFGLIAGAYLAVNGYLTDWIRSIARQ
jgi:hypothetical protein